MDSSSGREKDEKKSSAEIKEQKSKIQTKPIEFKLAHSSTIPWVSSPTGDLSAQITSDNVVVYDFSTSPKTEIVLNLPGVIAVVFSKAIFGSQIACVTISDITFWDLKLPNKLILRVTFETKLAPDGLRVERDENSAITILSQMPEEKIYSRRMLFYGVPESKSWTRCTQVYESRGRPTVLELNVQHNLRNIISVNTKRIECLILNEATKNKTAALELFRRTHLKVDHERADDFTLADTGNLIHDLHLSSDFQLIQKWYQIDFHIQGPDTYTLIAFGFKDSKSRDSGLTVMLIQYKKYDNKLFFEEISSAKIPDKIDPHVQPCFYGSLFFYKKSDNNEIWCFNFQNRTSALAGHMPTDLEKPTCLFPAAMGRIGIEGSKKNQAICAILPPISGLRSKKIIDLLRQDYLLVDEGVAKTIAEYVGNDDISFEIADRESLSTETVKIDSRYFRSLENKLWHVTNISYTRTLSQNLSLVYNYLHKIFFYVNIETGKLKPFHFPIPYQNGDEYISISDKQIAQITASGKINIYTLELISGEPKIVSQEEIVSPPDAREICILPDKHMLIVYVHRLLILDLITKKIEKEISFKEDFLIDHVAPLTSKIILINNFDKNLSLFNINDESFILPWKMFKSGSHYMSVKQLWITSSGQLLIHKNRSLELFDFDSKNNQFILVKDIKMANYGAEKTTLLPDGGFLFTAQSHIQNEVDIVRYDPKSDKLKLIISSTTDRRILDFHLLADGTLGLALQDEFALFKSEELCELFASQKKIAERIKARTESKTPAKSSASLFQEQKLALSDKQREVINALEKHIHFYENEINKLLSKQTDKKQEMKSSPVLQDLLDMANGFYRLKTIVLEDAAGKLSATATISQQIDKDKKSTLKKCFVDFIETKPEGQKLIHLIRALDYRPKSPRLG